MSRLIHVLAVGVFIRLVLPTIFPQMTGILSSTVEISTPINSFKSLQEAFYYLDYNIDLYDGGINHHPPILVSVLKYVDDVSSKKMAPFMFSLLYTCCDVLITFRIMGLNQWYSKHQAFRIKKKTTRFGDELVVGFYLLNPLTILTNLAHSTLVFPLLFLSESLYQATVKKNITRSMVSIAVAAYLSFNMAYLIVPIIALAQVSSGVSDGRQLYVTGAAIFSITMIILMTASFAITGSWGFLHSCYGVVFCNSIISPNLGLWWYIFTEMFDFFRYFYIGMFNLFSIVFIVPFTLRLSEFTDTNGSPLGDSLLAVVLSFLWLSFSNPYPTVGDLAYGLALIPIFKSSFIHLTRFAPIYGIALLICLLLSPIFYYCWIVLGNGNSNFFYSISLIWGTVHVLVMSDLLWARISADYLTSNGFDVYEAPSPPLPSLTQL